MKYKDLIKAIINNDILEKEIFLFSMDNKTWLCFKRWDGSLVKLFQVENNDN